MSSSEVAGLVETARHAAAELHGLDQLTVDNIVGAMVKAGAAAEHQLAVLAVEETGIGNVRDKTIKNHFSTQVVGDHLDGKPSVGVIDERDGIVTIAEPFGVIAAITPITNPTSTVMFKSLIALKGRNVVVFAFHPKAQRCGTAAARLMHDAAVAAGAPVGCIQWITTSSVEATTALIQHSDVALVLATGGSAMVRAAYTSGHPALGVGPGNVPIYIERTADLDRAVPEVIASKTFDYGTICSSDQSLIFDDRRVAERALQMFAERGAYLATADEKASLERVIFDQARGVPAAGIVGKSPQVIAELAGIRIPTDTRMILVPLTSIGPDDWMSHEKLSPVLGWHVAEDRESAVCAAVAQLEFGGAGHSAVIYTEDEEIAQDFALRVPANRVLWNQPAAQGTIGSLYNDLVPSLTLGCGAAGGNSSSDNIGYRNLINIKRMVSRSREYQPG